MTIGWKLVRWARRCTTTLTRLLSCSRMQRKPVDLSVSGATIGLPVSVKQARKSSSRRWNHYERRVTDLSRKSYGGFYGYTSQGSVVASTDWPDAFF